MTKPAAPYKPGSTNVDPGKVRMNHVNIVIGQRGSGKSYFTEQIISKYPGKVLIIDQVDNPHYRKYRTVTPDMLKAWRSGTIRIIGSDVLAAVDVICTTVSNALIVFEDATRYIRWNVPDNIRTLIIDTKQKNIDLIFIYHALAMVQPDMFRLADSLTIFKSQEDIKPYKNKIPNFHGVKMIFDQVNKSPDPYDKKTVLIN